MSRAVDFWVDDGCLHRLLHTYKMMVVFCFWGSIVADENNIDIDSNRDIDEAMRGHVDERMPLPMIRRKHVKLNNTRNTVICTRMFCSASGLSN